ncbi:MAG: hypothetical protein Q8M08_17445 [Bacteroidales bacterium]|nr:hypothetical protein [Bacteroidales bacterium]
MEKRKPSTFQIADSWAFYTIKIWKEKLQKLRIGQTGGLETSFLKEIIGTPAGDVIAIRFAFLYYGKFVDMGVGRGTKIGGVAENRTSRALEGKMLGNRRKPKKWYGKTFYAEVATLKEILAKEYGHKGALVIAENIGDNSIK